MQFNGTVTAISALQSGTSKAGKEWRKIDVVLTYDNSKPEYPKAIVFSVMNDNIEKFGFQVGGEYEVEVDFSVREYNGKNYMSANAWKATAKNVPTAPAPQSATPTLDSMGVSGYQKTSTPPPADDDLPF